MNKNIKKIITTTLVGTISTNFTPVMASEVDSSVVTEHTEVEVNENTQPVEDVKSEEKNNVATEEEIIDKNELPKEDELIIDKTNGEEITNEEITNVIDNNDYVELPTDNKDIIENIENIEATEVLEEDTVESDIRSTSPNIEINGSSMHITVGDGQNIPDLSSYQGTIDTFKVSTTGNKELSQSDVYNIAGGKFTNIDMSDANLTVLRGTVFEAQPNLQTVILPNNLVELEDGFPSTAGTFGVFADCLNLQTVVFPDGLEKIGAGSFAECPLLEINLPNSLKVIGEDAFCNYSGNGAATSLTIPNSVTHIGSGAFADGYYGQSKFSGDLIIPDSVVEIGGSAFARTGFDGNLTIGNSVKTIGYFAFADVKFTGDLIIPDSIVTIEQDTFNNAGFTGNLVIPNSVTSIGYSAFRNTGFTGELVIPDSVKTIGNYAFEGCRGFTGDLVIPDLVTYIGWNAFKDSGFTGDLVIGSSVKTIEMSAFENVKFAGDLVLGESVITVGGSAFKNTNFDGDLVIPNSVVNIYKDAFSGVSFNGDVKIGNSLKTLNTGEIDSIKNAKSIAIAIDKSHEVSNYRKTLIENLPKDKLNIETDSSVDIQGTWLKDFENNIKYPYVEVLSNPLAGEKTTEATVYIPVPYSETNVLVTRNGNQYALPNKDSNGNFVFKEYGNYELTVTSDANITYTLDFEVKALVGSISIKYIDDTTGNEILPTIIEEDLQFGDHTVTAEKILDYELIGDASKTITLTENNPYQVVEFRYVNVPETKGSITVIYVDDKTNQEILQQTVYSDLALDEYEITAKEEEGYTLIGDSIKKVTLTKDNPNQIVEFRFNKIESGDQNGGNLNPDNDTTTKPETDTDTKPEEDKKEETTTPNKPNLPFAGGSLGALYTLAVGNVLGGLFFLKKKKDK